MSAVEGSGLLHVVEHQAGTLLRLGTSGSDAGEAVHDLLGFLAAELEGEIAGGGKRRGVLKATEPVLIQLESLQVELATDGDEVLVRRVRGSPDEFDDLCEFVGGQASCE